SGRSWITPVREANAASKATIQAALESGSAAVQRLDAIVENTQRGDEEALGMWTTLRRISHIGHQSAVSSRLLATVTVPAAASGALSFTGEHNKGIAGRIRCRLDWPTRNALFFKAVVARAQSL